MRIHIRIPAAFQPGQTVRITKVSPWKCKNHTRFPSVRIAFIGDCAAGEELLLGMHYMSLSSAHPNLSELVAVKPRTFHIPLIHDVLTGSITAIKFPVGQYVSKRNSEIYPLNDIPAIANRNGNHVAAYVTEHGRSLPYSILLPQYKNNIQILIRLLEAFRTLDQEAFPNLGTMAWWSEDSFLTFDEKTARQELEALVEQTSMIIEKKKEQIVELGKASEFLKQILISTEDTLISRKKNGFLPRSKKSSNSLVSRSKISTIKLEVQ